MISDILEGVLEMISHGWDISHWWRFWLALALTGLAVWQIHEAVVAGTPRMVAMVAAGIVGFVLGIVWQSSS